MSRITAAWFREHLRRYFCGLQETGRHSYRRLRFLREMFERNVPKSLPLSVRTILVVCTRNLCRSPLAEVYLREKVRKEGRLLTIVSAGIDTFPGMPAHKLAREVAGQHGISLESHAARPIHQKLIQQADLVLVMEMTQKERIMKLYPQDRQKVFVLGRFCKKGSLDIIDPHRGGRQDFQLCFDRIKESCDQLLENLVRDDQSGKAAANLDRKE